MVPEESRGFVTSRRKSEWLFLRGERAEALVGKPLVALWKNAAEGVRGRSESPLSEHCLGFLPCDQINHQLMRQADHHIPEDPLLPVLQGNLTLVNTILPFAV